jgi:mannitol/fructose-specific phosphotransferase system IIA component (Ntr-type)
MKLVDFVCFKATIAELGSTERNAVITELAESLGKVNKISKENIKKITRAIIRRENEASTGLGKGVAVPHVKSDLVKEPIAAIGQTTEGIDFNALDKQLVYSVVLLISPVNDPEKHLNAMECVFGHLQKEQFRSFLRQSKTPKDVEDLFNEADENPAL